VLTTALDPLPHLYTVYSDNLESEDRLSAPAYGSNAETDQATSETDSSRSCAQGSACEDSQHSYTSTTRPLSLEISARRSAGSDFEIYTDSSSPPPISAGHTKRVPFAPNVPSTRYLFHPYINGEGLFIINASIADSVDQESLAERTVVIQNRENDCTHLAHQLQTQPIGEHSRARRALKWWSYCTPRLRCRKGRLTLY
jgi:hypothetical protein